MSEQFLLPEFLIVIVYSVAAILMMMRKQSENSMSRFVVVVWYFYIGILNTPLDDVTLRVIGRWLLISIPAVEILSYLMYLYYRSKYFHKIERYLNLGTGSTHDS